LEVLREGCVELVVDEHDLVDEHLFGKFDHLTTTTDPFVGHVPPTPGPPQRPTRPRTASPTGASARRRRPAGGRVLCAQQHRAPGKAEPFVRAVSLK
jgi:hypothetical protein